MATLGDSRHNNANLGIKVKYIDVVCYTCSEHNMRMRKNWESDIISPLGVFKHSLEINLTRLLELTVS